jgi:hypothetical protein
MLKYVSKNKTVRENPEPPSEGIFFRLVYLGGRGGVLSPPSIMVPT